METVKITKKIISIPSFVDSKNNESKLSQWIYDYLKTESNLTVEKEYLSKDRFNIVAYNNEDPDLLISGHIDTVQPKIGWKTNPFNPLQKEGKIFGLGASDMKAGIAVLLSTALLKSPQKIMYLFYCDEEYDFLGMKKFIGEYKNKIKPKLIISADGGARAMGNSCRGLIEIAITILGKSGHAANPKSGINAITKSFRVIGNLEKMLRVFKTPELGKSTLNVAYIKGGTDLGKNKLGKEGNIIPDYCEFIIEIRVADPKLKAKVVSEFLKKESTKLRLTIKEIRVRHDLGSWITPVNQLKRVIKISPSQKFVNGKKRGYIDIQMLWEAFGKVPCFTFGVGSKGTAHKENEFVEIKNIKIAEKFYDRLVSKYGRCQRIPPLGWNSLAPKDF